MDAPDHCRCRSDVTMPKASKSRIPPPIKRFDPVEDAKRFEEEGVVPDEEIGPLAIYLVRIFYPQNKVFHWALAWNAYTRNKEGVLEHCGWRMVDYQLQTEAKNSPLAFRHQYKAIDCITSHFWELTELQDGISADDRVLLLGWCDAWDPRAGGNCITCVCSVIDDLQRHGLFQPAAMTILKQARDKDLEDVAKGRYHLEAAF